MAQAEMIEFGVEQGQMLQVLMRHCRSMKRQETLLRAATALLLATFFATLLWLQFHQQTTTDLEAHEVPESNPHLAMRKKGSPKRHVVHLIPLTHSGSCLQNQPIKWDIVNDDDSKNFKLENKIFLQNFTKGLYLINLMISYRIAYGQCNTANLDKIVNLEVNITEWHSNYEGERVIVSGTETMLCREYWLQTITLTRVIMLEAGTILSVKINQESCKFVFWVKNSHLDVAKLV